MNAPRNWGVRIAGTGSAVPERRMTNADFTAILDTSDEWILQRTGISERRIADPNAESTFNLSRDALQRALDAAGMKGSELDLVIVGTLTSEMPCPSTAVRVAAAVGAVPAGAFDISAACCGFVYAMNVAETMVRSGRAKAVGVIGAETLSRVTDYTDRTCSILFGDGAGAAVLVRDEDPALGCIHQSMQADGSRWESLYLPVLPRDVPESDLQSTVRLGCLRMNGREVFKFAVTKFREVIEESLAATRLSANDLSQVICHQSNIRIIEAARERIGLDPEKVYVNIDRYGNTSAASVGICLDELTRAGKLTPGLPFMMVAFGGGLTWASSVWSTRGA